MTSAHARSATHRALRTIAILEALKGLLAFAIGIGIVILVREDIAALTEHVITHLHMNPAGRLSTLMTRVADRITDQELWLLAFAAAAYVVMRAIESYGLWRGRRWAMWFGVLSGLVYVPFELYEIADRITVLRSATLVVNLLVVGVLWWSLHRKTERGEIVLPRG